jgi:hypothetical protein
VQTPYFLGAFFPISRAPRARFADARAGKRGDRAALLRSRHAAAAQSATREYRGYFGPKEIERLEAFAPVGGGSIDLGWSFVHP